MITVWENLHAATLELVRSTPIKQRLIAAYRHLSALAEDQLPADIRSTFSQIIRSFTGVQPLPGEDAVVASVRKMSNQEADDCAALVVEIYASLHRAETNVGRSSAAVVQLRSVECNPLEMEAPELVPALIANH